MIFAEALSKELIENEKGQKLIYARILDETSDKYKTLAGVFEDVRIKYFLKLGRYLNSYLKAQEPLLFITDWTDPTEMVGVRLELKDGAVDYPDLCCIALYTDWEDISSSGIEEIFAHEFSHLWLHRLGLNMANSRSNKFHTCTAITDPYMAFSEGLAESLEIVALELAGMESTEIWDEGYDVNAWLCRRDTQLRIHAVKNNRFIYHTAYPYEDDFKDYNHLHMAHITSSAFTPERLKSGTQMLSSEGVIASIFYRMYKSESFKKVFLDKSFYDQFGIDEEVDPLTNLYIKILFTLSKVDLNSPRPMIAFINKYVELFPSEREELLKLFLAITHFSTVDYEAPAIFGRLYSIGRQGDVEAFVECLKLSRQQKANWLEQVLGNELPLDGALYDELWVETDSYITPVPWSPQDKKKYRIDINTATEIDFMAFEGVDLNKAKSIVKRREELKGFKKAEDIWI